MSSSKHSKSKPITTSVPSFAIRFHASGEELEELYPSEEEEKSERSITEEKSDKSSDASATTTEQNKHESSPMRDYLNKFGKRSSSIDTGINESTLNKETSDPWRIFSEFKGKLTKTVEEKLSEIKSKNSEGENSPKLSQKDKNKTTNNSKENSSVSDSEEQSFSECSIAKSSGLSSTAEDLEMSSDDENSLAESEKTPTEHNKDFTEPKKHILRHRIKNTNKSYVQFTKDDSESHVKITALSTVHEKDPAVEDDVESGVEACEDASEPRVQIPQDEAAITLIAPCGFVDLRVGGRDKHNYLKSSVFWVVVVGIVSVCFFFPWPRFLLGFVFGSVLSTAVCFGYFKLKLNDLEFETRSKGRRKTLPGIEVPILEVPAVKEYQPMTKFEGWMNEYPDHYDPRTYHIMKTQSVFLKLEGSVLRISHTRAKIPKRAMWDEPKHHVTFTHHRMYNLKGSQIMLLPTGLIHKRLWSKKYPICIILNKEKMNLDLNIDRTNEEVENDDDQKLPKKPSNSKDNEINSDTPNEPIEDTEDQLTSQIDEEKEIYSESYSEVILEEDRDELSITAEDWDTLTLDEANAVETKIYLFTRTCRDKEDWFRRLVKATHDSSLESENAEDETSTSVQPTADTGESGVTNGGQTVQELSEVTPEVNSKPKGNDKEDEEEFASFMARFNQVQKTEHKVHARWLKRKFLKARKKKPQAEEENEDSEQEILSDNHLWVNSLIARIIYDVRKHNQVIESFQSLIQKKISTIKLPYFIDSILLHHLTLGASTPSISNIQGPTMDERGLWFHLDIVYEGVTSMAIVTKLNLMKLKEQAGKLEESLAGPPSGEEQEGRSPIFHSDVEDSAESSDEEVWVVAAMASTDGSQNSTPRKPNTGGKKFLQMVDKIASSKYFQQATENKYIKRAMEGVSKTEIKLTVEIQHLAGTLAVNIPPPPSDRMWIGFQGNPDLQLSAHPTFGERSLNFMHVSRWIEKKLAVEFQKFLVLPNMEDFVLPMLIPTLPQ